MVSPMWRKLLNAPIWGKSPMLLLAHLAPGLWVATALLTVAVRFLPDPVLFAVGVPLILMTALSVFPQTVHDHQLCPRCAANLNQIKRAGVLRAALWTLTRPRPASASSPENEPVIPKHETRLTAIEQTRWQLTKLASALVRDGVPADVVMLDAREGCELATRTRRQ